MRTIRDAGLALGLRATRFTLRRFGFHRTVRILAGIPTPMRRYPLDPEGPIGWAERIRSVSGRPYGGTCLDRSVLLWYLMQQRGLDGRIRIGVARDDDDLVGHAWVELDGRVVNDNPDVAGMYSVFDEDPTGIVFS